MALTINTNMSSLVAQRNLSAATASLNKAIELMTTGYRINNAGDNAAGYSITKNWDTQIGSLDVAADNAATGSDMLATLEDSYSLVSSHLQRIRDLTEQAANGTYGESSLKAIEAEITSRLEEIDRISANCEFNGKKMMTGSGDDAVTEDLSLQIDLYGDNSEIVISSTLFEASDAQSLFGEAIADIASKCAGLDSGTTAASMLDRIDSVLDAVTARTSKLGAVQNRIDSAIEAISVRAENITSSLSTLRDADIADASSQYLRAQILQQAATTLLSTANQTPNTAINLI